MSTKPLDSQQLDDLRKLAELPDDEIDLADIPEIPEDRWALAFRPGWTGSIKDPAGIRLDADILRWFKNHSVGGAYQTEVNRVLREHVLAQEKKARS